MTTTSRQRCASALTHPVTVGALAILLINDLVLKALWSNPWTTGKLSDLTWVIFASPLLAFILAFAARRNNTAQRVAFITAYIGLPALYAAFNTFEPLHDLIISGLLLASGGSFGSPFDPTDSLVIPIGLAIAVWVWKRPVAPRESMRMRLALLAAGVAAFATVATSEAPPPTGRVGIINDEILFIDHWPQYASKDGGLTWEEWGGTAETLGLETIVSMHRGPESLRTSRGYFFIEGSKIIREVEGERETVYSPIYLENMGNVRFQNYLDLRQGCGYRCPSSTLLNVTYHPPSGNLVASTANHGVVVIGSDGSVRQVAVGRNFAPIDFSVNNKLRTVLGDSLTWWTAVMLSIISMAIALALAHSSTGTRKTEVSQESESALPFLKQIRILGKLSGEALIIIGAFLAAVLFICTSLALGNEASLFSLALSVVLGIMLVSSATDPSKRFIGRQAGIYILTLGVLALVLTLSVPYAQAENAVDASSYQTTKSIFLALTYFLGTASLVAFSPTLRQLPITIAALVAMVVLFGLALFIGIMQGFNLIAAYFYAVVLLMTVAITLVLYIRRSNNIPTLPEDITE